MAHREYFPWSSRYPWWVRRCHTSPGRWSSRSNWEWFPWKRGSMKTNPKTCRKAEVPCLTMGDYVNLCFLFLFSAHQALSCSQMEVYGPTTRQPDNPTTRQPAGTNYQHVYDGLQAVENAPAPNFPVSEPLEPLSCALLHRWIQWFQWYFLMFFVSCLFWSCDMPVVTCWVKCKGCQAWEKTWEMSAMACLSWCKSWT